MTQLICFSPRLLTEEGVEKQFVNTRYVNQLTERGFNTIQLTLNNPDITQILTVCDGFVLTGGTDLNPETYNEVNNGLSYGVSDRLDKIDKQMIEHAVAMHKPLLGICRGHQSLNVFLGGSLHQDLGLLNEAHKRIKEGHIIHMNPHPYFAWQSHIEVNSYHHQAIKDLAPSLDVIGLHDDQTIEMVVHKTLPIFSVQWHPEITPEDSNSIIIFDAFAKLMVENKKG